MQRRMKSTSRRSAVDLRTINLDPTMNHLKSQLPAVKLGISSHAPTALDELPDLLLDILQTFFVRLQFDVAVELLSNTFFARRQNPRTIKAKSIRAVV